MPNANNVYGTAAVPSLPASGLNVGNKAQQDVLSVLDAMGQHGVGRIPLNQSTPFSILTLDLADTKLAAGNNYPLTGYGILYRRTGSSPGGRLTLDWGGNQLTLYPGDRITGYFERFSLARAASSASTGTAILVVLTREDAIYEEPPFGASGVLNDATDILGSIGSGVSVNINTVPSGANPTGSFTVSGFKRIRVWCLGNNANTGGFDVIPWVQDSAGTWWEQGVETVTFPDTTGASAAINRVFIMNVFPSAKMYFEIRNLTGAATAVSFYVQGIE